MDCFDALVQDLHRLWKSNSPLSEICNAPSYERFIASNDVGTALDAIKTRERQTEKLYPTHSLADRIKLLGHSHGWHASLVRRSEPTKYIAAIPFPTVFIPLNGQTIEIATFHIDPASMKRSALPSASKVLPVATRSYDRAQPFATSPSEIGYSITTLSQPGYILRVTGPAQAPFIHFFDIRTHLYTHSAMASQDYTSRYFYAEALKNILYALETVGLSPEERSALTDFMQPRILPDSDMPNECWSLLQALFALDENLATIQLGQLAKAEGPLQAISAEVLSEFSDTLSYG